VGLGDTLTTTYNVIKLVTSASYGAFKG